MKRLILTPLESKNESCFSPISSYKKKNPSVKSGIYLTLTVATVTKMADKIGLN